MLRTSLDIPTAGLSLGNGIGSGLRKCVAVVIAVGAVALFAPRIGLAQHHGGGGHGGGMSHGGGGMHHGGGMSGGGMHHGGGMSGGGGVHHGGGGTMHHGGGYSGGTGHHGGYYGSNSYYRGGSYGYGGIGIGIGLGGLGYGYPYYGNSYNSYPRSYGNSYYGNSYYGNSYNSPYSGNRSYGAYSAPQYYNSTQVYSTQIRPAPAPVPVPTQPVMGNPLNGELRPGMVLPDGAVVISVDPIQ